MIFYHTILFFTSNMTENVKKQLPGYVATSNTICADARDMSLRGAICAKAHDMFAYGKRNG